MKKDYRQLDGLRAIAAVAVVCFHYCPRGGYVLDALIASGPAAVGFFFLLTGFVLALRHPGVPDLAKFWRARFLRIYPMYLLAFLLFAPIAFQKYHHDPETLVFSFFANLTMLQAWTNLAQSWNGPSWSLSVEAFLYAIFPFLVRCVSKRPSLVYWGLLAMVPAILTIGFCNQWIPTVFWRTWIGNNPLFGVPAFSFGIALGLSRLRSQGTQQPTDMPIVACLVGLVAAALLWPSYYREVFVAGGVIIILGLLIVLCTYRSRVMQTVLGNSMIVRLGRASYITYIMQSPLWHYFQVIVNLIKSRPLAESTAGLGQFLIFVPALLVVSVLLDRYIDEPVRAAFTKKKEPSTMRGAVSAAA